MLKSGLDKKLGFRNTLIINDDDLVIALLNLCSYSDLCLQSICINVFIY